MMARPIVDGGGRKKAGTLNGKPVTASIPEQTVAPRPAPVTMSRQTMTVTETVELVKELGL